MAIKGSGSPLSITEIKNEFGGSAPHSLSEYKRAGGLVPESPSNSSIPTTNNNISISDFYGATNTVSVTYEIQGGGGAGGGGYDDRGDNSGTANGGGATSITYGSTTISAAGGGGGIHGGNGRSSPYTGTAGQASHYGSGGSAGGAQSAGGNAPSSHYGAGGGGAGGDASSRYDRSGAAGTGGNAGTRKTGTVQIVPGTVITYTVGGKGVGGTAGNYPGGSGAGGYVKITRDGTVLANTTSSGSVTV